MQYWRVYAILELNGNGIQSTGLSCLADAVFSGKINIEGRLELSDNPLGVEGCEVVCRMLSSSHCQAWNVSLFRCKLTTTGCCLPSMDCLSLRNGTCTPHETLIRKVANQLFQMPLNTTITHLGLGGSCFTQEGALILAGFMHLCGCMECLVSCDSGITSDDIKLLLEKLTELKCSSPSLCSKLEIWFLHNNEIDDNGVSSLIDHLPSLFPCLGYTRLDAFIHIKFGVFLDDNPVSTQMQIWLDKKWNQRQKVRCCVSGNITCTRLLT